MFSAYWINWSCNRPLQWWSYRYGLFSNVTVRNKDVHVRMTFIYTVLLYFCSLLLYSQTWQYTDYCYNVLLQILSRSYLFAFTYVLRLLCVLKFVIKSLAVAIWIIYAIKFSNNLVISKTVIIANVFANTRWLILMIFLYVWRGVSWSIKI